MTDTRANGTPNASPNASPNGRPNPTPPNDDDGTVVQPAVNEQTEHAPQQAAAPSSQSPQGGTGVNFPVHNSPRVTMAQPQGDYSEANDSRYQQPQRSQTAQSPNANAGYVYQQPQGRPSSGQQGNWNGQPQFSASGPMPGPAAAASKAKTARTWQGVKLTVIGAISVVALLCGLVGGLAGGLIVSSVSGGGTQQSNQGNMPQMGGGNGYGQRGNSGNSGSDGSSGSDGNSGSSGSTGTAGSDGGQGGDGAGGQSGNGGNAGSDGGAGNPGSAGSDGGQGGDGGSSTS
ncbi:MAG: hypothetical protein ACFWT0_10045 [Bifidobacterium crudilactis]|jgi:hypothetical protein|uniref:hypothetical protein n=1 Tax=Bifidobacterium crudilactis TaxID=327277 RepID=UPI003A5BB55D